MSTTTNSSVDMESSTSFSRSARNLSSASMALKSSTAYMSSMGLFSRSNSETSNGTTVSKLSAATRSSTSSFSRTGSSSSGVSEASLPLVQVKPRNATNLANPKTVLGKRKDRDFSESPSSARGPTKQLSTRLSAVAAVDPDAPVIISYSAPHQRLFNSLHLPYGVQYEIARLASAISTGYENIDKPKLEELEKLGKHSKAIPLVPGVFGEAQSSESDDAFAKEIAAKSPWVELDLEDEILAKNPLAGLGLSSEAPDWFGGKVHFTAKLIADPKNKDTPFKVILKIPELGPSDRFARRWGSRHFLTISLSRDVLNSKGDRLEKFLYRPFILLDHVFRAFDAKDGNVFFVCTNEIVEGRRINPTRTVPGLLSLRDFLAWHNSLELDLKQTMAKWASRFALGRSNSAPVLRLDEDAVIHIPDIISESGSDMTDGAGLINKAGLRLIYNRVEDMDAWPTAIQCRVLGAKGLLVMHPTDTHETPRIWLRPSQIKVKHTNCRDPTLRTIDLLRTSHAKTQCRLSVETIINLAENGVPASEFIKLVEVALANLVTPLITWEGQDAMELLWCAVARSGGVMTSRLARKETVLARLKGYMERDNAELEDEDEEGTNEQPTSTAWWVDNVSGCPSSLEETVMYLLDAGFTPQGCSVLRSKLEKIVKGCVDRSIDSYRIDLPIGMSGMAFLVPDELGVLEAGEFFFKSSRHDIRTLDGLPTDTLLGDALITRHPCKLPTDVQKWKAVDRPELRHFTDVIVCSIKGPRRAADFLSGGDYDGDKGLVIWQPELVEPFVNAPLNYSEEPPEVAGCFSPRNETVEDFLQRTESQSPSQQVREMQHYLLSAIRNVAVVGKYSNWHINAIYTLGYTHPETIRLAYMFCKTLDGAKTGLTVHPDIFSKDQSTYERRPPAWKEAEKKKGHSNNTADPSNMINLGRPSGLHTFIMDKLHRHANRATWGSTWGRQIKEELDKKFTAPHIVDADLTGPWYAFEKKEKTKKEANDQRRKDIALLAEHTLNASNVPHGTFEIAQRMLKEVRTPAQSDLEKIQEHVQSVYAKHKSKIDGKFTKLPIEKRQDILRELSRDFATGPPDLSIDTDEAARVKASYAYFYDSEQRRGSFTPWSRFPWDVAFRELCLIKTRSSKTVSLKPVNSEFYERFTMKMPRV
ncbi:RNA dependent RNA polymerase-domain-containing protein [Mycena sp. CBHHK59/15]|nr:RNA dependent RNA polymerase-domain-containing protein [Mycena sp. CBHHK59/15]